MSNLRIWIPAFIWLIVITGLSVMPGVQLPAINFVAPDKLAHAFVYAVFSMLLMRGLRYHLGRKPRIIEAIPYVIFATLWGAFMEWVQYSFFPGRYCEFDDILANMAGAVIPLIFVIFRKK